ncbi:glycosyltransferase family 4 protein [Candidatus Peregrinibacteria bacterium]|nr:MAG: glycosyltransferase family 4 protein [Candidatus Peregrinibacteria bacterium]
MPPKTTPSSGLLITRFPLESGWGGEEELHLFLAKSFQKQDIRIALWSSCPFLLSAFQKQRIFTTASFFRDITSRQSLFLFLFLGIPFFFISFFRILLFRSRGFRTVLMLTLVEKVFLTPFFLFFGYRIFWAHHAPLGRWLSKNPFFFLWRFWGKRVLTIVPSLALQKELLALGLPEKNIRVLQNPLLPLPPSVETWESFLLRKKVQKQSFIVGIAGRLSVEKNLSAALRIATSFPEILFLIAGEGELRESLSCEITEQSIDNVALLGNLSEEELSAFFSGIDLFLSTSRYETFGLALLQAQAHGVPVVAPRVGGVPEVVVDGFSGILFPVDDEEKAVNALRLLFEDRKKREEFSKQAQQQAKQFSSERYKQKMMNLLFPYCSGL